MERAGTARNSLFHPKSNCYEFHPPVLTDWATKFGGMLVRTRHYSIFAPDPKFAL